ncbi:very short patch repair endonuclease [Saccharothrix sp. HUAS TT1]|uniref:very short patch repair endonuclease n=1 Tax=unclassified Saccharothrix TaxID=2593673 RepID=UPI00345BA1ED
MAEASWATSEATRKSMRANRSRDTKPELRLRRALHAMGLRYRVCARPLPEVRRTADIVFPRAKVAVEVRGCFWHGCPDHYRAPAANGSYWSAKVQRNIARDADTAERLAAAGWLLAVVWEHEDLDRAAETVARQVQERRSAQHTG